MEIKDAGSQASIVISHRSDAARMIKDDACFGSLDRCSQ